MIASLCSSVHKNIVGKIFCKVFNHPNFCARTLLIFIWFLSIPFYLAFCYLALIAVTVMNLYTSRIFVAFWKGTRDFDLGERTYNVFVNKFFIFQWIFRGPACLLLLTLA